MFALFPTLILSVSWWLALQASATAVPFSPGAVLHGLLARQTDPLTGLPPSCKTGCSTVLTNIQSCASIACLCTTTNSLLLRTCVECLIGFAPGDPTVISAGQNVYQKFDEACSGTGIPSHTLLPQSASSTSMPLSATAPSITDVFPTTTTSRIVQFTITTMPSAAPQSSSPVSSVPPITTNGAPASGAGMWGMLGFGIMVGLLGVVAGIV